MALDVFWMNLCFLLAVMMMMTGGDFERISKVGRYLEAFFFFFFWGLLQ